MKAGARARVLADVEDNYAHGKQRTKTAILERLELPDWESMSNKRFGLNTNLRE